jgi:membrane protein
MNQLRFLARLFRDAFNSFLEDRTLRMAGALAYYSVFSMAPLILIAIGVASQFFDKQAARAQVLHEISDTVGPSARDALAQILDQAGGAGNGIVATVVGVVLLLVGASGAFAELQDGLNNIWKVKPKPGLGIWELIKNRLLSITVVLGTGFLLLVSLVLSAVLSALGGWMENHLPGSAWIWQVLNGALSFAVVALLFAMIFKILPDARIDWRDVWIGAVVTAALFTIGKAVIGAYLGRSGLAATYGAAGSIVVLLTWVYYSAVILLFGAEFTHVYALATRRHVEPMDHAVHDKPASQGAHAPGVRRDTAASPSI